MRRVGGNSLKQTYVEGWAVGGWVQVKRKGTKKGGGGGSNIGSIERTYVSNILFEGTLAISSSNS